MTSSLDLAEIIANRRWVCRLSPFPHFIAENVFTSGFYQSLESEFREILNRGLAEYNDPDRFSRNMMNSDAYSWNFPSDINGCLSIFYSLEWHKLLSLLTKAECTMDVNGALHHHQLRSKNGSIHRDLGVGWFSNQKRGDGVNPMDISCCTYTHGPIPGQLTEARETVRAVTMIYYLANHEWTAGDGGETGLYKSEYSPVDRPLAAVPPINNSLIIFENTPDSYHSFITNRVYTRNSAILWLHRSLESANKRWPNERIYRWKNIDDTNRISL